MPSLVIDGTTCFESSVRHFAGCTEAERNGVKYYQYRLLIASIVHRKTHDTLVIGIEPILNTDGAAKNDCEMNAAKRLLEKIHSFNPWMRYVVIADGLYTAAPILQQIKSYKWEAIITLTEERMDIFKVADCRFGNRTKDFMYTEHGENNALWFEQDSLAEYWPALKNCGIYVAKRQTDQIDGAGKIVEGCTRTCFFISTIPLILGNIRLISQVQRARWGIENTTINNLKNKYNMKHIFVYEATALVWVFASLAMNLFVIFVIRNHIRLASKITMETFAKQLVSSWGGLAVFSNLFSMLDG